jgi:hypothetical protein
MVAFAGPVHMLTCAVFANADSRDIEQARRYRREFLPEVIAEWYTELDIPATTAR